MRLTYKYLLFLVAFSCIGAFTAFRYPHWGGIMEMPLLGLGIFLTGIPHGAMDHYIARQQALSAGKIFSIWKFIARYVGWIVLYTLVWWVSPGVSLILFLLLSAWHFGETDFKFISTAAHTLRSVKMLVYGLCLVTWLLLNHATALQAWIELLAPACTAASVAIKWAVQIPLWLFWITSVLILLPVKSTEPQKWIMWLLFSGFLFLCGKMSLLTGFALYFTGWHGVLAFIDINNFLTPRGKILAVWRHSIPLSVIAYTFLLLIYFFTDPGVWQNGGLPAIFILLSVLTLPHTQVMHQLYRRIETV